MFKKIIAFTLALFSVFLLAAQAPDGLPYANPEPVDFNLFNTILLIVLPLLIFIIYFWWRRKKKRNKNK